MDTTDEPPPLPTQESPQTGLPGWILPASASKSASSGEAVHRSLFGAVYQRSQVRFCHVGALAWDGAEMTRRWIIPTPAFSKQCKKAGFCETALENSNTAGSR